MKILSTISRILVGLVFIFSGFVKGIDPIGTKIKFTDYFTAFGMDQLEPLAFTLAILLILFEFMLGVALIVSFRIKVTSWVTLIFMSLFTLLTLYLAIDNPVSDCGCFGDAIIMTNWETFWKNVIITGLSIIVFVNRNNFKETPRPKIQYSILSIAFVFLVAIIVYCYSHLPIIDFRPYNIGANITEKMEVPEDAPQPEYETILKYEKDGEIKEFTMDSLPDSTWSWVETENKLIKEGYQPPIQDFTITAMEGHDITDIILEKEEPVFLLISFNLEKASDKNQESINELARLAIEKYGNQSFICLTASTENEIEKYKDKHEVPYSFYHTDEITLKTIIRSNPGLVLIKEGTVLDKWHYNDIPTPEMVEEKYF
ncbi:MAG: BT_3928 family protein [Bacteroidales bacterium]